MQQSILRIHCIYISRIDDERNRLLASFVHNTKGNCVLYFFIFKKQKIFIRSQYDHKDKAFFLKINKRRGKKKLSFSSLDGVGLFKNKNV